MSLPSYKILTVLLITLSCISTISVAQPVAKIIGGKSANISDWPWMAGIVAKNRSNFSGQFCGASLIAEKWVLTAAHCMKDVDEIAIDVIINQAELDRSSGERIGVKQVIVHPLYDDETLDNDLALIQLEEPSRIKPINILSSDSVLDRNGIPAIALGWGALSELDKSYPTQLQEVDLPIVDNAICSSVMSGVTHNMLCAGTLLGEVDTCLGDSGGPLIVFDSASNSWRQAGITSWGNGCATKGFYGVYTRVNNYVPYISKTICSIDGLFAPSLSISTNGNRVMVNWNQVGNASGYRLDYAPFPQGFPINSIDMNETTQLSVDLNSGSAFYVAITSYNDFCSSQYSNIESFTVN